MKWSSDITMSAHSGNGVKVVIQRARVGFLSYRAQPTVRFGKPCRPLAITAPCHEPKAPSVGLLARMFSSVVFPEPDGPMRARVWPGLATPQQPCKTCLDFLSLLRVATHASTRRQSRQIGVVAAAALWLLLGAPPLSAAVGIAAVAEPSSTSVVSSLSSANFRNCGRRVVVVEVIAKSNHHTLTDTPRPTQRERYCTEEVLRARSESFRSRVPGCQKFACGGRFALIRQAPLLHCQCNSNSVSAGQGDLAGELRARSVSKYNRDHTRIVRKDNNLRISPPEVRFTYFQQRHRNLCKILCSIRSVGCLT